MFCRNCGKQILDNANFCIACGTPVTESNTVKAACVENTTNLQIQQVPQQEQLLQQPLTPRIGFSPNINHPEIIAAIKNKKAEMAKKIPKTIFWGIVAAVAFVAISSKLDAKASDYLTISLLITGAIIVGYIYERIVTSKFASYEGVVIDKYTSVAYDRRYKKYYPVYIVKVRKKSGLKKKILDKFPYIYDFLQIGDRFFYHAEERYYELYDKTRLAYTNCIICRHNNPLNVDRCEECGVPLLK